jgi:hypothetical protein
LKISVLGWYGHGNLGDEAMLEALQYQFTQHFGPCQFRVLTDYATRTVPQFTFEAANDADLFVLGGGELINRQRLFIDPANWSLKIRIPKIVMACGVNANSLELLQDHVKESLRDFDYIGVRDQVAYSLLCGDSELAGKTHLVLSPSLTLAEKHGIRRNPLATVAAVIPTERCESKRQYDEGILNGQIPEGQLRNALAGDGFKRVMLMAFGGQDNDDYATCRKLQEYLTGFETSICKPATAKEALQILSECGKAYTYRLHGMLLAHSLGIPYVAFGYHRKIQRNHDTIIRLSRSQALRNIHEVWANLHELIQKMKNNGNMP